MAEENTDFLGFRRKKKSNRETDVEDSKLYPPQEAVGVERNSDYYNMDHYKRGKALIFNHNIFDDDSLPPRDGTDLDAKTLQTTLENLQFDVTVYKDLRYGKVYETLTEVAKEDHSDSDCLVVVVMSHGDPGILHARNNSYPTDLLWSSFSGDECPSLAGKPKLFFIQACRGGKLDKGVNITVEHDAPSKQSYLYPVMADILVMYSTSPDHYSFRNPTTGSWFIQALCKELNKRARSQDLLTILTFVNRTIAVDYQSNVPETQFHRKKQVGNIVSSLTRLVYFYSAKEQ